MIVGPKVSGLPTDRRKRVRGPRSPSKLSGQAGPFWAVFHQNIFKTPKYSLSGYRIYCVSTALSTQNLVVAKPACKGNKNSI